MTERATVAELDRDALVQVLAPLGASAYRADQILRWFYKRRARSFEQMTDLPASLRRKLPSVLRLFDTGVDDAVTDADGTVKLVVALRDGHRIESVMIPRGKRRTACVSTQVGCSVG